MPSDEKLPLGTSQKSPAVISPELRSANFVGEELALRTSQKFAEKKFADTLPRRNISHTSIIPMIIQAAVARGAVACEAQRRAVQAGWLPCARFFLTNSKSNTN